jgi:GNAT superfamily N-acetyltransferase
MVPLHPVRYNRLISVGLSRMRAKMSEDYQIVERMPILEEYHAICTTVGWAEVINFEAAKTALPNSLYGVVAVHAGLAVGMGRIVGDGAIFFYIQDIAVLPEHQGKGVGGRILAQLMAYLRDHAPEKAFIGLFAAEGTLSFYERYGFRQYPDLTGIYQVILRP